MAHQFLQVAFAGHNRPDDLGDTARASAALRQAFGLLREAGVEEARLLTGLAAGADQLAAKAWQDLKLGPIHAVHPFLPTGKAGRRNPAEHQTWLDGDAAERSGRSPHLVQTRWLIDAADLLVVVWTGQHGRGAGGTADAVRLAVGHGLPVLWINPQDEGGPQLIRAEGLVEEFGFLEFLDQLRNRHAPLVAPANAKALAEALADVPQSPAERGHDSDLTGAAAAVDGWLHGWLWRAYAQFRKLVGGTTAPTPPTMPVPADLQDQPGFVQFSAAYDHADQRASRLGSVHRSQQLLLLGAAIAAAIVGSAPAVWPQMKLTAVSAELLLALFALFLWSVSARAARHESWGRARRLAEQLRIERVGWALGLGRFTEDALHVEPAVQAVRRAAGLPEGAFDGDRVARWGAWAAEQLIGAQAGYHRGQAICSGRITHRIHQLENLSFAILLLALGGFLAAYSVAHTMHYELPRWLAGVVVMTGAIVPAIGAACLALEATMSFGEDAQRSELLARRLEEIRALLPPQPTLSDYRHVLRLAAHLQVTQEERWREATVRRRLFRG